MSKYYTPDISEFHVGFEYEILQKEKWVKDTYLCNSKVGVTFDDMPELTSLSRVKYLDRSDIESFGFTQKPSDERVFMMYLKETAQPIFLNTGWSSITQSHKNTIVIDAPVMGDVGIKHSNYLFNGTIKNRSQLSRILKMIGVI